MPTYMVALSRVSTCVVRIEADDADQAEILAVKKCRDGETNKAEGLSFGVIGNAVRLDANGKPVFE